MSTPLMNTALVNHSQTIANVFSALLKVHGSIDSHGLERKIYHLVLLCASQINGCGYCVKMHTKEAREDGETDARLDSLIVWRHVDDFTPRERAALAWTEALTRLERHTDYGPLRAELREHFSEEEISALTANITMINLWNRIHISGH